MLFKLIRIWNSRDGVTPFMTGCPSCGGDMQHVMNHHTFCDTPTTADHKPFHGQWFWRDATRQDYEWMYREVVKEKGVDYVNKLIDDQLKERQPWLDCYFPEKEHARNKE